MEMAIQARTNGQSVPVGRMSQKHRETFREQVLTVDSDGKASAMRRTYTVARDMSAEGNGPARDIVRSYQGKTVTIRRVGDGATVTVDKGSLTAKDRAELQQKVKHVKARFFADHPVAIGEEWMADVPPGAGNLGKD